MEYSKWRADIFGQPRDAIPVSLDLLPETYRLSLEERFDHIDRALVDHEIHELFDRDQIGIGLELIYSFTCSNFGRCYIEAASEERRIAGIHQLDNLYNNFFKRYCLTPLDSYKSIGASIDGVDYTCYMLWDTFVLCPANATAAMVTAALDVMANALRISNDNCIVSAIHGLGHWVVDTPHAANVLRQWLQHPTTSNAAVIEYARIAETGCIQ